MLHISSFDKSEKLHAFEIENHANYIFQLGVELEYFVLACKKSNLREALLFQINLPLLKHFVDKNR